MAKRTITLKAVDGVFDEDDVIDAMETLTTCLTFIGGQAAMGVQRAEVAKGRFAPVALHIQYDTFVPAEHLEGEEGEELVADEEVELVDQEDPGEDKADGEDEDGVTDFARKSAPATLER